MSKNVLILMGSPRKKGNTSILCDEFARGAEESGNRVEKNQCDRKAHQRLSWLQWMPAEWWYLRPEGRYAGYLPEDRCC